MKKNLKTALSLAMFSCALSFGAHAADDATKAQEKQIEANYKSAKDQCAPMKGNEKDVCQKQAKADYDKAKTDLKANRKVADTRGDAAKDKAKEDYKVAKEKCDAMSGDAKDQCQKQAKATYNQ